LWGTKLLLGALPKSAVPCVSHVPGRSRRDDATTRPRHTTHDSVIRNPRAEYGAALEAIAHGRFFQMVRVRLVLAELTRRCGSRDREKLAASQPMLSQQGARVKRVLALGSRHSGQASACSEA
jgi:hypothetical protein